MKLVSWFKDTIRNRISMKIKHRLSRVFKTKLQRDVERLKKTGKRFTPPLPDFPPMVMVDATSRCNLACAHCPNSVLSGEPDFLGDIDPQLFYKIVDEIALESPRTLFRPFDSGESLMRKDLEDLLGYAYRKGLRNLSLTTNGTMLVKSRRKRLIENGLHHLEVSIDAATPETYLKIRRSPLFDKVVENTLAYIRESKAYNPKNQVAVSFVLQADNRHEVDRFKAFWRGKADLVHIRQYHQHHGLVGEHGHFRRQEQPHRHPCPFLWDRIIIGHDGRVSFCEFDGKREHTIGDVHSQSIKEIWHSPEYQRLRREHIEGTFEEPYCKTCPDWPVITWFPEGWIS